jgi:hypothetical protein
MQDQVFFSACCSRYPFLDRELHISVTAQSSPSLALRLRSLGRSLPITPDHNHAQETSHNRTAEEQEDYWNANGPDAGREEGLDEVRVVDEGL